MRGEVLWNEMDTIVIKYDKWAWNKVYIVSKRGPLRNIAYSRTQIHAYEQIKMFVKNRPFLGYKAKYLCMWILMIWISSLMC